MSTTPGPSLDDLSRAIGEPTRLRILQELLGGIAFPAGALAARLDLAPSTISAHLTRLHEAGLITIEQDGRRRLARLADPAVATALEALLQLSQESAVRSLTGFQRRSALREARSCYDHLAGRLGVALADLALERRWVQVRDGVWMLPEDEESACARDLGLVLAWPPSTRPAVRPCQDWTERRPHLAGRLGRSLLDAMLDGGWLSRRRADRALTITPEGRRRFTALGLTPA